MAGIISPSFQQAYLYSFFYFQETMIQKPDAGFTMTDEWMDMGELSNLRHDTIESRAKVNIFSFYIIIQLFFYLYVWFYFYGNTKNILL